MRRVNGLEAARAALIKGDNDLLSPPSAACQAGVNYYVVMIEKLRKEFPHSPFAFHVCCGSNAAIAHDALRLGLRSIVFQGTPEMIKKITAIADGLGASVMTRYPA